MTDYAHLQIDTQPSGVRTITLDRPDKLNAVNGALAASLIAAFGEAARSDDVRVVVITGAGRAFCSGLDLSMPPELPTATRAERLDP
jgi:2-(1,2-epoxy-1,2-dihydrophenyl)acetyl-CoA isomerase